jgi:hypothetical protein
MTWCQFHQCFLHAIFVRKPFSSYVLALNELSYEKCARKTLMKLSPGVNVINVLLAAFTHADTKSRKDTDNLPQFSPFWGMRS